MESVLAWPTRGIPLAALARRAPASASAIEEELAALFFIRNARASETPMPPMETDVQTRGDRAGEAVALVLPLRRRPESQHPFISIGRLDGNDLALPDASVSKFHAYVKQRENGFLLQDARSRNGTSIDGAPVPARGEGPPLALRDGQHIKLGAVELTCINAASLLRLLRARSAAF